jgi:hypothetical protein
MAKPRQELGRKPNREAGKQVRKAGTKPLSRLKSRPKPECPLVSGGSCSPMRLRSRIQNGRSSTAPSPRKEALLPKADETQPVAGCVETKAGKYKKTRGPQKCGRSNALSPAGRAAVGRPFGASPMPKLGAWAGCHATEGEKKASPQLRLCRLMCGKPATAGETPALNEMSKFEPQSSKKPRTLRYPWLLPGHAFRA